MQDTAKERISDIEVITIVIFQNENQSEKRLKKRNIQELWDNYKRCNIYVMGIPEGEEREERTEEIFKQ